MQKMDQKDIMQYLARHFQKLCHALKNIFGVSNKTSPTFMYEEDPSPQKERSTQDVGLTILLFFCFNLSSRYSPRERGMGI